MTRKHQNGSGKTALRKAWQRQSGAQGASQTGRRRTAKGQPPPAEGATGPQTANTGEPDMADIRRAEGDQGTMQR